MRLVGKSAIVTGAGRGIGKATALRFAREGADVLGPDLDLASSQHTAKEIQALGRKGVPMQMDVNAKAVFFCLQAVAREMVKMKQTRVTATPLGRIETPEDVANLYTFLASDEASYITGQTYNVCGGLQLN